MLKAGVYGLWGPRKTKKTLPNLSKISAISFFGLLTVDVEATEILASFNFFQTKYSITLS